MSLSPAYMPVCIPVLVQSDKGAKRFIVGAREIIDELGRMREGSGCLFLSSGREGCGDGSELIAICVGRLVP